MTDDHRRPFDSDGFFGALDRTRIERGLLWKDVAAQAKVSASTLTRLAQGRRPDVDSLAALVDWGHLRADDFVRREQGPSDEGTLTQISTYLRGDKNLTPEAATALDELIRLAYDRLASDH